MLPPRGPGKRRTAPAHDGCPGPEAIRVRSVSRSAGRGPRAPRRLDRGSISLSSIRSSRTCPAQGVCASVVQAFAGRKRTGDVAGHRWADRVTSCRTRRAGRRRTGELSCAFVGVDMTQLPIPVHVGSEPPSSWDDIEARQREFGDEASPSLQNQRRPAVASPSLDWEALGFEPRWVGFDTADCAAALQPSIYTGHGADEFDRFRQGAGSRGEISLVISPIGDLQDKPRSILVQHDDSISLGRIYTTISSRPIGKGARVRAAADLGDADGQLALRMLSCSPAPLWRVLSLSGVTLESYNGREHHPPRALWCPSSRPSLASRSSPRGCRPMASSGATSYRSKRRGHCYSDGCWSRRFPNMSQPQCTGPDAHSLMIKPS